MIKIPKFKPVVFPKKRYTMDQVKLEWEKLKFPKAWDLKDDSLNYYLIFVMKKYKEFYAKDKSAEAFFENMHGRLEKYHTL